MRRVRKANPKPKEFYLLRLSEDNVTPRKSFAYVVEILVRSDYMKGKAVWWFCNVRNVRRVKEKDKEETLKFKKSVEIEISNKMLEENPSYKLSKLDMEYVNQILVIEEL